jgi:predicted metallopeptidase
MKYEFAPDLQRIAEDVSKVLFPYINMTRVKCFRSYGSSSKRTLARCHALNKIMQKALGIQAFYPLEFLSENFDKLSEDEQVKIIIHELMHIPKSFGGGFRHHDFVCDKNVNKCYKLYKIKKEDVEENKNKTWW